MKVKLLKKVRKRYSVLYFPKGMHVFGLGVYEIDLYHVSSYGDSRGRFFNTKNECLDWIMKDVRRQYGKKKYNKGIKVW